MGSRAGQTQKSAARRNSEATWVSSLSVVMSDSSDMIERCRCQTCCTDLVQPPIVQKRKGRLRQGEPFILYHMAELELEPTAPGFQCSALPTTPQCFSEHKWLLTLKPTWIQCIPQLCRAMSNPRLGMKASQVNIALSPSPLLCRMVERGSQEGTAEPWLSGLN